MSRLPLDVIEIEFGEDANYTPPADAATRPPLPTPSTPSGAGPGAVRNFRRMSPGRRLSAKRRSHARMP